MVIPKGTKCCAEVRNSGGWHTCHCGNKATVEADGKFYCGVHSPEAVERRRKRSEEKYDARVSKEMRMEEYRAKTSESYKRLEKALDRAIAFIIDRTSDCPDSFSGMVDNWVGPKCKTGCEVEENCNKCWKQCFMDIANPEVE